MRETVAHLNRLQTVIDNTYRRAGRHLMTIHTDERRLGARDVCELLQGVCVMDLATVSSLGSPMVAPVDGLFLHGEFWFGSAPDSLRFRHIRRNPRVSAAFTRGEEISIVVHGVAHEIDTATGQFDDLRDYCLEVYGPEFDSWGYWENYPYARLGAHRFYAARLTN